MLDNNVINSTEMFKLGCCVFDVKPSGFTKKLDRTELLAYASLDASLDGIDSFYMFGEDYLYNISINHEKGHNLFLKKSSDGRFIEVYSTNYHDVRKQENGQKGRR